MIAAPLEARVRVADSPRERYARRVAFYRRYGFGRAGSAGYGASELAFTRWLWRRGALDPDGSAYWRRTNAAIADDSERAARHLEAGARTSSSTGGADGGDGDTIAPWLAYFAAPSGARWYRAHTASLVRAMVAHVDAARREPRAEQRFISLALYRLLFAEAVVRGAVLGPLGRVVADPRRPAVAAAVRIPRWYPRGYPVRSSDIGERAGEPAGTTARGHAPAGLSLGRLGGRALARRLAATAQLRDLVERYLCPMTTARAGAPAVTGALEADAIVAMIRRGEPLYPDHVPPDDDRADDHAGRPIGRDPAGVHDRAPDHSSVRLPDTHPRAR